MVTKLVLSLLEGIAAVHCILQLDGVSLSLLSLSPSNTEHFTKHIVMLHRNLSRQKQIMKLLQYKYAQILKIVTIVCSK